MEGGSRGGRCLCCGEGYVTPGFSAILEIDLKSLRRILKIGHRGAAGHAPENTLASVEKGIGLGADYVEVDIQRTLDGRLVLMHDKFVNRTTDGTGRLAELRWDQLSSRDAGGGQRIPLLQQTLEAANGR